MGVRTSIQRPNSFLVLSLRLLEMNLIDATIFSRKICRTECGPVNLRHMSRDAVSKFSYLIFKRFCSALQTKGDRCCGRIS